MELIVLQGTSSQLESPLSSTVHQILQATELCVISISSFAVSQLFNKTYQTPMSNPQTTVLQFDNPVKPGVSHRQLSVLQEQEQ